MRESLKSARMIHLCIQVILKTLFFNFHYLPFAQANKLPIIVSHRVWLLDTRGKVVLHNPKFAQVKLGFGSVTIFDEHHHLAAGDAR